MSPGGYSDLYLLHRLTLFKGGQKFKFYFFFGGGWNYSKYFCLVCNLRGYFWACQIWYMNFLGDRSLQNIAFCKIFCDIFTKNVAFYYFCKQTPCVNYGITVN